MQARLTRSRTDRMIGGVCGGLGQYFGVDPVIVRLIFVVTAITIFITIPLYPLLWWIMPPEKTLQPPSMPLPPDARFDPMTGQPLPPAQPATGQTVNFEQSNAPATPPAAPPRGRQRTLGLLLVGIGGVILLHNVGEALARLFNIDVSSVIFPVLLVGLGIYLLRKKTV